MKQPRTRLIFLVLLFALVVFVGCIDDPERPADFGGLVGSWQWVEVCFPYPIDCLTPESEGFDTYLDFSFDSTYKQWRNDTLLVEGGYSVVRYDDGNGPIQTYLVFDTPPDTLLFFFEDASTLIVGGETEGSAIWEFTRISSRAIRQSGSWIPTK